jgi:hypothetical protein
MEILKGIGSSCTCNKNHKIKRLLKTQPTDEWVFLRIKFEMQGFPDKTWKPGMTNNFNKTTVSTERKTAVKVKCHENRNRCTNWPGMTGNSSGNATFKPDLSASFELELSRLESPEGYSISFSRLISRKDEIYSILSLMSSCHLFSNSREEADQKEYKEWNTQVICFLWQELKKECLFLRWISDRQVSPIRAKQEVFVFEYTSFFFFSFGSCSLEHHRLSFRLTLLLHEWREELSTGWLTSWE